MLFPALFEPELPINPVGTIRHVLGHVLGFRHEHISPEAKELGVESHEPIQFGEMGGLRLGEYNPQSVMHYHLGDTGSTEYEITPGDAGGLRLLYTLPEDLVSEFDL